MLNLVGEGAIARENERWRELAAKAAAEQDPKKLIELVEQLNRELKADAKPPKGDITDRRIA